ncbi:hypothetical protein CFSAN001697_23045 [Salmonella enterica subsp. enterica serovar Cerro str. CFSAN001697]|nr:hypothetical protein CFSAN001697_23045 [Salmonella enterica subsp. enterica serovar Cerro str. CFSAN001697]
MVTGGSLLLFAVRGHRVRSRVNNALWSRESLLLGNNVLLMAAMLVVLLGTLSGRVGLRGRCNGAKPCTEAAAATLCVVG